MPLKKRRKSANPVSRIGTARINNGNADGPLPGRSVTQIERSAITYPKNMLPESPMKIEAWGRLNNQKPSVTPTNTKIKMSREYWPCHKQSIPKHANAIITKPLAKPSKPSIKLIAFITPTIHKIVIGQDQGPRLMICKTGT